jgi:regulator of nonsense transcripts 3
MSAAKPAKERTKVVVRSLPPALAEDAFRKALDKTCEGKYDWFSYFQGKIRSGGERGRARQPHRAPPRPLPPPCRRAPPARWPRATRLNARAGAGPRSQIKVVFSRAYINFKCSEDLFDFKDKFHGHVFVSNKGNQYVCNVEYAPSQKVPKPVEKKDPRDGTIERGGAPVIDPRSRPAHPRSPLLRGLRLPAPPEQSWGRAELGGGLRRA